MTETSLTIHERSENNLKTDSTRKGRAANPDTFTHSGLQLRILQRT